MAEGLKKFLEGCWFKLSMAIIGGLFTIITTYGAYHLNKLDNIVREIQDDKIELIDRINEIDDIRENDITEVKVVMNEINTTLKTFIARTEASRFTSDDGLQVWQEISTIKQQVIHMQKQIEQNQLNIDRNRQ